ncbi:hypothetical protein CPB86DRAFT_116183 [Serendipita vermifera]|nr:hypothetical protein CPB86DRAFT_116183 [Serendipita vermifera]
MHRSEYTVTPSFSLSKKSPNSEPERREIARKKGRGGERDRVVRVWTPYRIGVIHVTSVVNSVTLYFCSSLCILSKFIWDTILVGEYKMRPRPARRSFLSPRLRPSTFPASPRLGPHHQRHDQYAESRADSRTLPSVNLALFYSVLHPTATTTVHTEPASHFGPRLPPLRGPHNLAFAAFDPYHNNYHSDALHPQRPRRFIPR